MPVSKKPRKKARIYPARATSTPFLHVEIRVRLAYEHLRQGSGFTASHFDHLAMAQRLSCLLGLTDDEERLLNGMAATLSGIRQAYKLTGVFTTGLQELAQILEGICTMESVWARYPKRHLEACYDREMLALYDETTALIAEKTRAGERGDEAVCPVNAPG